MGEAVGNPSGPLAPGLVSCLLIWTFSYSNRIDRQKTFRRASSWLKATHITMLTLIGHAKTTMPYLVIWYTSYQTPAPRVSAMRSVAYICILFLATLDGVSQTELSHFPDSTKPYAYQYIPILSLKTITECRSALSPNLELNAVTDNKDKAIASRTDSSAMAVVS